MYRRQGTVRQDWQAKVEAEGLVWHTLENGTPYWDESVYYEFSPAQVATIEDATRDCYQLFLEGGQYVLDNDLLAEFGIPEYCHGAVRAAWDNEPPALNFGRFDFGYDGRTPPKLFEFNADTPTSLLEASVIQWSWKEEVHPRHDQYNSLHPKLLAKWQDIAPLLPGGKVHFCHVLDPAGEDTVTVAYWRDLAREAGLESVPLLVEDIGWNAETSTFRDLDDEDVRVMFHLYPWEWLVNEQFGKHVVETLDSTLWLEPIWKMLWSNKAMLPVLSKLNPYHPNLLTASKEPPPYGDYVRKPLLAREGANVTVHAGGADVVATAGDYGTEGYVYQELYALPDHGVNARPVIGAWIVDGEPAGMGIREDGLVTGNTARFVPHIINSGVL